ncbi:MAG TPA: T9SS type A sorting domain-containing protein [Rubricoccaceae bacterium]|nr:T9SS type A sorting domain-containing protein [Rubricoccaceae bacterium]
MRRFALPLALFLFLAPVRGQDARFIPLGDFPGGSTVSIGYGVSPGGHVAVGQSNSANGPEAFRWRDGMMEGLGDLPGSIFASGAWAASSDGSVIVGRGTAASGFQAFRWENGVMTGLGGPAVEAYDVTPDGAVVVGQAGSSPARAFRWEGGALQVLPDLPGGDTSAVAYSVSADGRIVVGYSFGPDGRRAVRWVDGAVEDLGVPAGFTTHGYDISADGRTVVGQAYSSTETAAFVWEEGQGMRLIPPLPGSTYREARSVSGDGHVVAGVAGPPYFGVFVWTEETGTRLLEDVLKENGLDLTGWSLGAVLSQALSSDGRVVVGQGHNPQGQWEGWMAVLPPWPVTSEPEPPPASALTLSANPNPARARTTVRLALPNAAPAHVALYDVLGKAVAVLHDSPLAAGAHALPLDASGLPPGVYFVRAEAAGVAVTRPLTVLR